MSSVLLSNKVNYWTGSETRAFEQEFAAFAGTNHAIAVANGTLALDLAFQGLGIGSHYGGTDSDEVIVTPRSFMASVSSIVNAGARPVFADVGLDSQNIEASTVAPRITANTRAILCVHLAGWPCDMDELRAAIGNRDIALIEDCAQAHGALYKGRPVGGIGDVAAWSFCQDKIITTGGEGGMVTCNDPDLWTRMWSFKDHGKSWDAIYNRDHLPGFRWIHESIGTNWRLTEMQSVIGRIQLARMGDWNRLRTDNAQRLTEACQTLPALRVPQLCCEACPSQADCHQGCRHAWYKYYVFVRPDTLASDWDRDRIVAEIAANGVPCMQGSCSEIYQEKAFDGLGVRPSEPLKNARILGDTSMMFLVHPTLTQAEIDLTVQTITDVVQRATR